MNTNKQDIVNLVEILARLGLKAAVLTPGSRNAPLIKAFNRHPGITCYSLVDERSAAFFALGIAQQTRKPVAVVCTSGSALLNFGPATVEAYYQRLPLLVISADRPLEWIGQADGQAMDQYRVLENFTKGYFECRESKSERTTRWHNERSVAEAYQLALTAPFGPVHINVPLSEPLYQLEDIQANLVKEPAVNLPVVSLPDAAMLKQSGQELSAARRVLILVGQHHPDEKLKAVIHQFAGLPQVAVLTETTANLFGNGFVDHIDRTLATIADEEKAEFGADILVTFGGMVVTKRLKQFLRSYPARQHWHIDTSPNHIDTYQSLTQHIQADALHMLEAVLPYITPNNKSDFSDRWAEKKQLGQKLHELFLKTQPYCDLTVFGTLLNRLPPNCILQIGNSTPVRYTQLFNNMPGITHYCNRGVSGIDGCTSTAAGASVVAGKPTVLLSGEVSFLYDNNGLWNKYIPDNFTAIVINNNGGNIFRIIEGPDQFEEMPEFIETTHNLSVKPLAELHGFRYLSARTHEELENRLSLLYNGEQKTILEIFTPQLESPEILKKYWKNLAENSKKQDH